VLRSAGSYGPHGSGARRIQIVLRAALPCPLQFGATLRTLPSSAISASDLRTMSRVKDVTAQTSEIVLPSGTPSRALKIAELRPAVTFLPLCVIFYPIVSVQRWSVLMN